MSSATERLTKLANQLPLVGAKARITSKHDDDAVICVALRTAVTRARKGGLAATPPEELLASVFKALIARSGIDASLIEDVAVGNVLPPGSGATVARMAALYAGIPVTAGVNTVNRQCSSGLQSVWQIANEIACGQIDIGIGAGVESMTFHYGQGGGKLSDEILSNKDADDCTIPMGITSENVATDFGITRLEQDVFAAESQQRAVKAQKAGKFVSEIIPVTANKVGSQSGEKHVVDADDGVRDGVTVESLSKLAPAFSKTGSTHAGNASQVSDGAAGVLVARRSVAKKLGLPILGKFVSAAVVGVPPRVMGIGPAFAIPKLMEKTGLTLDDVDYFEINEAFASQAVMTVKHLGLDTKKVNPLGGAIALGHPLGCTGSRQIATAFPEAKREGHKLFVTSMCIGSGMGMAALFVNEQ